MALALIAVVCLGSYGALEAWRPAPRIQPFGMEKRVEEEKDRNAKFWDGTRARRVEADLRRSQRLRGSIVPYWAAFMLQLNDSPKKHILIGKDGWLFRLERVEISERARRRGVAITAHVFGALSRRLAGRGTELVLLPIPRKANACPSKLPDGFDGLPEFEEAVFSSLAEAGVRTVDPRAHWATLDPLDRYQRYDSHWAQGARIQLARQVVREVPELTDHNRECWYQERHLYNPAGNLYPLGIPPNHRAAKLLLDPAEMLLRTRYARGLDRSKDEQLGGDAVMVGTSFTGGYDIHTLISVMSQSWIKNKSKPGERAMHLLGQELLRRSPEQLPKLVLHEFPVHYVAVPNHVNFRIGAYRSFLATPPQIPWSTPHLSTLEPIALAPRVGAPWLSFPPGSLPTSGEGVVSVELKIHCEEAATWRIETTAMKWELSSEPGSTTHVLPLIEDDTPEGWWKLTPLGNSALRAKVSARVVLEASPSGVDDLEGLQDGNLWVPVEPLLPKRFDRILAQWSGESTPMKVRIHWKDAKGEATGQREVDLPGSTSGFFVIDLTWAAERRIESIEVPAAPEGLTFRLVKGS